VTSIYHKFLLKSNPEVELEGEFRIVSLGSPDSFDEPGDPVEVEFQGAWDEQSRSVTLSDEDRAAAEDACANHVSGNVMDYYADE